MTISDRAAAGEYATGNQSGPAVTQAVEEVLRSMNNRLLDLLQLTSPSLPPTTSSSDDATSQTLEHTRLKINENG